MKITIGGIAVGVLASIALPELMAEDSRLRAGAWSLGAAALGYALLWLVLEAGKKAFGKKRIRLDAPTPFSWVRDGDDAEFVVGEGARPLERSLRARERPDAAALRRSAGRRPVIPEHDPAFALQPPNDRGRIISARSGRSHLRHRARAANPARSDGPRRSEISSPRSAPFSAGARFCAAFLPVRSPARLSA